MTFVRLLLPRIILASVTLWLAACPSLGPRGGPPPTLERAETLAQRGEHAQAARVFEALADQNIADDATRLRLRSVREWLAANAGPDAARVYDSISPPSAPALRAQYGLLGVAVRLARGDAPGAFAAITALPEPPPGTDRAQYWSVRQRAALAVGRANDAILAQSSLEAALPGDAERLASRRDLLRELQAASERGIKLEPQSAGKDSNLRGWLELGLIAAQAQRGARVGPALANWRTRFPQHAAQSLASSDVVAMGPDVVAPPPVAAGAHIAVLLPQTGRAAGQAGQIRDGLLASWFGSAAAATLPPLRFYDTATLPVPEAIRNANEAGAELIIGPLLREDVQAAADYSGARPPILALNFLAAERAPPENFFQYALSPEDEARGVARRALAEGRRRAVALVPFGDWGTRVVAAFTEELQAGGGTLLASSTYNAGSPDHSSAISSLLRINDSKVRARRIEALIGGSVNVQPRRRGDIDFIFVPSTAQQARQLRPQLKFFYAGDIPAYATSDAYDGAASADADGLIFSDMPWVLTGSSAVTRARTALKTAYGDNPAPRGKLFAFGYDAWSIASALRSGGGQSMQPFAGLTGDLSLDAARRVRRDLEFAQIRTGGVRLLGGGGDSGR